MISRIRDRIIYADPNESINRADVERRRVQMEVLDERIRNERLIPSTSGPPPHLYGQHLPLATEEPEKDDSKKKKREKGVWYVPWYEEEDELSPSDEEASALSTMEEVLNSINSPNLIWDLTKPKGVKSRENFAAFIQLLGVAMWRASKAEEDSGLFGGGPLQSKAVSGIGIPSPANKSARDRGGSSRGGRGGRGRSRGRGGSIGGPPNSANVLGT